MPLVVKIMILFCSKRGSWFIFYWYNPLQCLKKYFKVMLLDSHLCSWVFVFQMSAVAVNEENSESSSSDDSQSLLCSFNANQSREAPQGTEVTDLSSSGNKEEKKELQEHHVKSPESVTSTITLRTCPNAASQSGNHSEKSDYCLGVSKCAFHEEKHPSMKVGLVSWWFYYTVNRIFYVLFELIWQNPL